MNNGRRGGWAACIIEGEKIIEMSGGCENSTNSRMELTAIIEPLQSLQIDKEVTIYCDSDYIVKSVNNCYYKNWQSNGWKTTAGKPVANKDLWEKLLNLISKHDVKFIKVKGHSGDKFNERCDKLAKQAAQKHA